jgi:hypothetical protein
VFPIVTAILARLFSTKRDGYTVIMTNHHAFGLQGVKNNRVDDVLFFLDVQM